MEKGLTVRDLNSLLKKLYESVMDTDFSDAAKLSILNTFASVALPITVGWPRPHGHIALCLEEEHDKLPETKADFRNMARSALRRVLISLRAGEYEEAGGLSYSEGTAKKIEAIFGGVISESIQTGNTASQRSR